MEKKNYVKPSMTVYELRQTSKILVGSDTDRWGYIPGMPQDEKHLA